MLDPHPPTQKIKKRWDPYASIEEDPNGVVNLRRARERLPPVDDWNIGVEYEWDGTLPLFIWAS